MNRSIHLRFNTMVKLMSIDIIGTLHSPFDVIKKKKNRHKRRTPYRNAQK